MNNIYVCMNVFNEANTIKDVIEAINPFVTGFIIVDGAYKEFPLQGDNGSSNDGTIEIIKNLQEKEGYKDRITLIETDSPWEDEIVKRSEYLKYLNEGDYFMRLDGDEYLYYIGQRLDKLDELPFDAFSVLLAYEHNNLTKFTSKVFIYKYRKGMRYEGGHAHLVNDETGNRYTIGQMHLIFEELYKRPLERQTARNEFYQSGGMK